MEIFAIVFIWEDSTFDEWVDCLLFYVCSGSVVWYVRLLVELLGEKKSSVFNLIVAEWGKGHSELAEGFKKPYCD